MMVKMMNLDHGIDDGPQQQVLVLHSVSINNIMPCIVDIDVINGYHHLKGGGGGAITLLRELNYGHVDHVLAMALLSSASFNNSSK